MPSLREKALVSMLFFIAKFLNVDIVPFFKISQDYHKRFRDLTIC